MSVGPDLLTEHYRADYVLQVFEGKTKDPALGSQRSELLAGYALASYFLAFGERSITDDRYLYTHPLANSRMRPWLAQPPRQQRSYMKVDPHAVSSQTPSAAGALSAEYLGLGFAEVTAPAGSSIYLSIEPGIYQAQVVEVGLNGYCGSPTAIQAGTPGAVIVHVTLASPCDQILIAAGNVTSQRPELKASLVC